MSGRFRIESAVRQAVIIDGLADGRETRLLIEDGWVMKDGVWSRQYRLRPLVAGTVEELPGRGELLLRAAGHVPSV